VQSARLSSAICQSTRSASARTAYTSGEAHLTVPLEAQPVAVCRELADVADRSAAHQLGEREDLGDGRHRSLGHVLISGSAG
jgi:hypothetical protein